jgi:hypothetical protein
MFVQTKVSDAAAKAIREPSLNLGRGSDLATPLMPGEAEQSLAAGPPRLAGTTRDFDVNFENDDHRWMTGSRS